MRVVMNRETNTQAGVLYGVEERPYPQFVIIGLGLKYLGQYETPTLKMDMYYQDAGNVIVGRHGDENHERIIWPIEDIANAPYAFQAAYQIALPLIERNRALIAFYKLSHCPECGGKTIGDAVYCYDHNDVSDKKIHPFLEEWIRDRTSAAAMFGEVMARTKPMDIAHPVKCTDEVWQDWLKTQQCSQCGRKKDEQHAAYWQQCWSCEREAWWGAEWQFFNRWVLLRKEALM